MTTDAVILIGLGAVFIALLALLLRLNRKPDTAGLDTLLQHQAALAGRLSQLADSQAAEQARLAERLQAQERALAQAVESRLMQMGQKIENGLSQSSQQQAASLQDLRERLAVIDAAQKTITDLSSQVVSLQDILSNKNRRGAFGELQLTDLVSSILPPSAYSFQTTLSNGRRVDCLLQLPNPPGPIGVDAKFPLESWHGLRTAQSEAERIAAERLFSTAILKHVKDIAERYIIPGETAESALMFLPSEAIYAELHANFPNVVEQSYRLRVWIVSPTTLMATLNTVRAVLRDVRMREQAGVIQREMAVLLKDVERLDTRVMALDKHFQQAVEDIRQVRISTDKIGQRAEKIEAVQLGDDASPERHPTVAPALPLDTPS